MSKTGLTGRTGWRAWLAAGVVAGFSLLALASTGCGSDASADTQARALPAEKLQRVIEQQAANGVPGLIVRVETKDGQVWTGAAGKTTLEGDAAMTTETLFPTFSLAKMAVAAATLSLAEYKVISLDDPLSKWLDAAALAGLPHTHRMTVRDLVLQTSGIRDYFDDAFVEMVWADPTRKWAPQELVRFAANGEPAGVPGDGDSDYSNTNYVLLGLLLEKATGTPLASVLRQRVFEPLGMTQTASWEEGSLKSQTGAYMAIDGEMIDVSGVDLSLSWGGGGLVSTAADMAKLVKGYATGGILSEATRAQVLSTFNPMHGKPALTYGYGITHMDVDGTQLLGTTGEGVGIATAAFYDEKTGTTIVVFTNVFSEALEETMTEVVRALR